MNFEEYLISKKIDLAAFKAGEPLLFESWKLEFGQMHVNSFTVQKLNLINPLRRRFALKDVDKEIVKSAEVSTALAAAKPIETAVIAPKVARPVIKPKPKID